MKGLAVATALWAVCILSANAIDESHPTPTPNPSPPAYQPSRDELRRTNQHILELAKQLQDDLDAEKAAHSGVTHALRAASIQIGALQKLIDDLATRYQAAAVLVQKQKAAILRRDIIIGLGALAIGAWAFLKFYMHIPFL
jgi:hypothetical protein